MGFGNTGAAYADSETDGGGSIELSCDEDAGNSSGCEFELFSTALPSFLLFSFTSRIQQELSAAIDGLTEVLADKPDLSITLSPSSNHQQELHSASHP